MIESATIAQMYDLSETIAAGLFTGKTYPWEVLPEISAFILRLGETLDEAIYERRAEDIWVARSATIAPTASLHGPLIIDEEAHSSAAARSWARARWSAIPQS